MFVETLIILVKIVVIMLAFGMTLGALLTVVERKQSAFIHNRIGPNRANIGGHIKGDKLLASIRLGGVIHLAADGIKMIFKEDIVPSGANRALHTIAPMLMLFPALVLFAVIPWADYWCAGGDLIVVNYQDVCLSQSYNYFSIADLDVGFLYVFAIASLGVYGVAIAGWASNSKFSLLGGLRASSQMISYEVPMGLSVLGIVMIFGTLNLNEIVRAQGELAFGVLPTWGIFVQPLGFLIFLVAMIAETKRAPFDLPEGESEIVAGYLTEFTSMKFGTMMISEFVAIGFVGAMVSTLFLGGWQVPYLYGDGFHVPHAAFFPVFAVMVLLGAAYFVASGLSRQNKLTLGIGFVLAALGLSFAIMTFTQTAGVQNLPYALVVLLRIAAMVAKVFFMCWMQLMIRWTVPRFRYDQVMRLGWKVLLPAALLNLLITAVILIPLFS